MGDIKEQIKAIDGETPPTLEKLDKKMNLIIYQLIDMGDHEGRIICVEEIIREVKSNIGVIKWVGGTIASLGTILAGWLTFFKNHGG